MAIRQPTVAGVTITPELWARSAREPDVEAEAKAIRRLADTMATAPAQIFQACVDAGLELCRAGTCGISVYERTPSGEEIFRWIAMAGELKHHLNGTTPRHFSPCGICVESGAPLLMRRPELVYTYLDVGPPFHDVLLIPLTEKGSSLEATIWVVSHDPARKFDAEDARMMQRVAVFTATALQMARVADDARAEAANKGVLLTELEHRVKNTLQVTASLIRLQLGGIADPAARAAIESAQRRVLTMGQIHRIGSGAAAGDLAAVIRSVCDDLTGPDLNRRVRVEVPEVLHFPAHKAAVVALIVNELITNAVKHAFGDGAGTVTVTLCRTGPDQAEISVADDGAPLPADALTARAGLGLKLVRGLANQLGGELAVETATKRFKVSFPLPAGASH